MSEEAKDLISKLVCKPEMRLTAREALKHPWIKTLAKNSKKKIRLNLTDAKMGRKMKKAALTFIAT